jgi:hypothetical protein
LMLSKDRTIESVCPLFRDMAPSFPPIFLGKAASL